MKIKYTLDGEGGIDPTDPLGDLIISDDKGNSISLIDTFVDVWLLSFLSNITPTVGDQTLRVDVLEEPYFVFLTKKNNDVTLSYNNSSVTGNINEIILGFKEAANKLIADLSGHRGFEDNKTIALLAELLK